MYFYAFSEPSKEPLVSVAPQPDCQRAEVDVQTKNNSGKSLKKILLFYL